MSSALTRLEDALADIGHGASADYRTALADVRAELAQAKTDAEQLKAQAEQDAGQLKTEIIGQVQPLLASFEGAVKVAVEQAEPGIQSNVAGLLKTLLADVAKVAGIAAL